MKILMLGWEYPPKISGGLGIASQGLAAALSKSGVNLDFLVPSLPSKAKGKGNKLRLLDANDYPELGVKEQTWWEEVTRKVSVLRIGSQLMPYLTRREYETIVEEQSLKKVSTAEEIVLNKISLAGGYGPDLMSEVAKYALAAKNLVEKNSYDIVHAHDWMTFEAGLLIKEVKDIPLVVHIHSTSFDRNPLGIDQEIFAMEKAGLEKANHIIAVSKKLANDLVIHYKVPRNKITVIHNAINQGLKQPVFQSNKRQKKVLFVGRLTAQKGPSKFIDVATVLHRELPSLSFTVAGDGYLREALEERVKRMGLGDSFKFVGFKSHQATKKIMAEHDLVLLPSLSEPFSLVAVESVMAGTPVIISKNAGVTEVIKSMKGLPHWDTYHWVNQSKTLLTQTSKSKAYWQKLYEDAKRLTWNFPAKEVKNVYQNLTS